MRQILLILLMTAICCPLALCGEPPDMDMDRLLVTLRPHPRIILDDERMEQLRAQREKDPLLRDAIDNMLTNASRISNMSRGEQVSESAIPLLAFAWRWTEDDKYLQAATLRLKQFIERGASSKFLEVSSFSTNVAIGYDWLYEGLSLADRMEILEGLKRHALSPGAFCYSNGEWWTHNAFNWNPVCNAGMIIGALAIADEEPELARTLLTGALKSLPIALETFAPDGAWPEGPGYWLYTIRNLVPALAAMETALGTDYGLSDYPGLDQTGWFAVYVTGPTGTFNYADSSWGKFRPVAMYWLAQRYDQPGLLSGPGNVAPSQPSDPLGLAWYPGPVPSRENPLPLDRKFEGSVEVAMLRSGWDADSLFLAVKAGYGKANHGHLDMGSFVLDALGTRWAHDLGPDSYNLDGYWGSKRWSYYRCSSHSHNIPLVNGSNQTPSGVSRMTSFRSSDDEAAVAIDLSGAYSDFCSSVHRGMALVDNRRAVLVQDEFRFRQICQVQWQIVTDAHIEPDGKTALLRKGGKILTATILEPSDAVFEVRESSEQPVSRTTPSVQHLVVRPPADFAPLRITVLLAPKWEDGATDPSAVKLEPLRNWQYRLQQHSEH